MSHLPSLPRPTGLLVLLAWTSLLAFPPGADAAGPEQGLFDRDILPYRVHVHRLAEPEVGVDRVAELAQDVFGFGGDTLEDDVTVAVLEANEPGRSLVLYRASGAMEFVDESKYRAEDYTPTLPAEGTAEGLARTFLQDHDLLPPHPTVETWREELTVGAQAIPNALAVRFEPRLEIADGVLAPVRDGEITVWLGDAGEVIRLESLFRGVEGPPTEVPRRSDDEAWDDLADRVVSVGDLTLAPAFAVREPHLDQSYLDPVFELRDPDGLPAAITRATRFTPLLSYLGPDPSIPLFSATTVMLRAGATEGAPPYRFLWTSSLDGPLGEGETLPVVLSPGTHRIDLEVEDANQAGLEVSVPLVVRGLAPEPADAASLDDRGDVSVGGGPWETERLPASKAGLFGRFIGHGIRFNLTSQERRPMIFNSVRKGGFTRARNVYFDQFWYELTVNIGGVGYTLWSQKCQARETAGVDACVSPRNPFAQSRGATPIRFQPKAGRFLRRATVDNLPGTFTLFFDYGVRIEYCGPDELGALANRLGFLAYPVGGKCPGLRPTVRWTYEPPPGGAVRGEDVLALCGSVPQEDEIHARTSARTTASPGRLQRRRAEVRALGPRQSRATIRKLATFPAILLPGSIIEYRVELTNDSEPGSGPQPAEIRDEIPDGTTYVARSVSGGKPGDTPTYIHATNEVFWSGTLAPGEAVAVEFSVEVDAGTGIGDTVLNTASGTVGRLQPEVSVPLTVGGVTDTPCSLPEEVLEGIDPDASYPIVDFVARLSTAVQSNGSGHEETSSLVQDAPPRFGLLPDTAFDLARTVGSINRATQPIWALGDSFTFINAVLGESGVVASLLGARGDWDNVHLKEERTPGIFFPGCNDPRTAGVDRNPCLHLHENWLDLVPGSGSTYSRGQIVFWYDLRFRPGAEESPDHPTSLQNGEPLISAGPFAGGDTSGHDLVLWVESIASSRDCRPPRGGGRGPLDNTRRSCEVFPQAVFFTPR